MNLDIGFISHLMVDKDIAWRYNTISNIASHIEFIIKLGSLNQKIYLNDDNLIKNEVFFK